MNSRRFNLTVARRPALTRASFSPVGGRTSRSSLSSLSAPAPRTVAPGAVRTVGLRTPAIPTIGTASVPPFPSFWSSGALDRVQPEVTRFRG